MKNLVNKNILCAFVVLFTIIHTVSARRHARHCSLDMLRYNVEHACENMRGILGGEKKDFESLGYDITDFSNDDRISKRSIKDAKIVRRNDFPKNGYMIFYYPLTTLLYGPVDKESSPLVQELQFKRPGNHSEESRDENNTYKEFRHTKLNKRNNRKLRTKRSPSSYGPQPAVIFCCTNECSAYFCFHA